MPKSSYKEVKPEETRWFCDPAQFDFETTDEVECCTDIIGQARAITAIKLGLEVQTRGYNIFVSGLTGTGKSTTIKKLLQGMELGKRKLSDICYVHNFKAPEMPICITLPAGKGVQFRKEMARMFDTLTEHVPQALDSEPFKSEQKKILEDFKERKNKIADAFEKAIAERGFSLFEVQYGPFTRPEIMPSVEGKSVAMEKLPELVQQGKITEEQVSKFQSDYEALVEKMEIFLKESRELDKKLTEKLSGLEMQFVDPIIDTCLGDATEKFRYKKVRTFLKSLGDYVRENLSMFKDSQEARQEQQQPNKRKALEFEVNVVVNNSATKGVPVIIETAPTYSNLFGTIERTPESREEYKTDFTKIRAGSLVQANGGYLVLNLSDIAEVPAVWPALKRALKNQKITIQGLDSFFLLPMSAIKPEPITLNVKVVLIGDAYSYQILYNYDEDFRKVFKVKADFDNVMPNTPENLKKYAGFVKNVINESNLLAFDRSAVAAVIEEGARIAGRRNKLSTQFSDVADVVREASYWSKKAGDVVVEAKHVEKAIEERIHRVNLIEEKIKEMMEEGIILLDIAGSKVGQINGLSVYDMGDYAFGKPSRITVETALGRSGVINIEREADLSGKTHNKGVLILEGYMRRQYAQDKPLTMSASICFEQSYSGIDGDSASSTEIYGLLSSLAEVPLRQDLAVTGSVNQKGEIQPIGGVNEKIEGFYDICQINGITGTQGVMIPALNLKDLMLRKDVIKAVAEGKFHIYSVSTINEGIELLTGRKAGKRLANGGFEKDSIHYLVNEKLRKFAEKIREFYETGED
jgi:lon-related putative ATP-dependent protease